MSVPLMWGEAELEGTRWLPSGFPAPRAEDWAGDAAGTEMRVARTVAFPSVSGTCSHLFFSVLNACQGVVSGSWRLWGERQPAGPPSRGFPPCRETKPQAPKSRAWSSGRAAPRLRRGLDQAPHSRATAAHPAKDRIKS